KRNGRRKHRADEERIILINACGDILVPDAVPSVPVNNDFPLSPGDTIFVPIDTDYIHKLHLWSSATQNMYQKGLPVAPISSRELVRMCCQPR
ncbi:hypothetical protein CWC25_22435, partial [Pseudoalteromonas sp. S4389]|uniref:hypothetical protein n=1 Tax=Pseudoalteromonas sp. S4389 TaxID=579556 RepID=UPI001271FC2B